MGIEDLGSPKNPIRKPPLLVETVICFKRKLGSHFVSDRYQTVKFTFFGCLQLIAEEVIRKHRGCRLSRYFCDFWAFLFPREKLIDLAPGFINFNYFRISALHLPKFIVFNHFNCEFDRFDRLQKLT